MDAKIRPENIQGYGECAEDEFIRPLTSNRAEEVGRQAQQIKYIHHQPGGQGSKKSRNQNLL